MPNSASGLEGLGRRSILRGAAGIASATLASGCVTTTAIQPRDFVLIRGTWRRLTQTGNQLNLPPAMTP